MSYKAYRDVAEKIKPSNTTSYMDINWREGFVESKLALSLILHSDIVKASIEELQMMLDWQSLAHVEEKSLPKIGTLTPQVARALENSKVKLLFGDLWRIRKCHIQQQRRMFECGEKCGMQVIGGHSRSR